MAFRVVARDAMAAHAKRSARQFWQGVPASLPVIRSAHGETRLDALLERRGARRVIATKAHPPHADARVIEIVPPHDEINDGLHLNLVITADREIVFAPALPRPIEPQR